SGDQIFPEGYWFRMWIIDAKNSNTALDPEQNDALHLCPELEPVGATEVQRKNVFVFFRRIFGKLNGAVRSFIKPFRMLGYVGMIRGTVDGEIEGNFQSPLPRFLFQPGKILQC